MEYNFLEIGENIRQMRKKKFGSQDDFIDALSKQGVPIGRNKVSAIENGEKSQFTLPFLLACCNLFNCDMGYLLGEYECRTKDIQFIHEQTGLSEKSILTIQTVKDKFEPCYDRMVLLNYFLESTDFMLFLSSRIIDYSRKLQSYQTAATKYYTDDHRLWSNVCPEYFNPDSMAKIPHDDNGVVIPSVDNTQDAHTVRSLCDTCDAARFKVQNTFNGIIDKLTKTICENLAKEGK